MPIGPPDHDHVAESIEFPQPRPKGLVDHDDGMVAALANDADLLQGHRLRHGPPFCHAPWVVSRWKPSTDFLDFPGVEAPSLRLRIDRDRMDFPAAQVVAADGARQDTWTFL